MTALTPGLSTLLDTVVDRFADDKTRRDLGVPPRQTAGDEQLALFDVDTTGTEFKSFDGEHL